MYVCMYVCLCESIRLLPICIYMPVYLPDALHEHVYMGTVFMSTCTCSGHVRMFTSGILIHVP